MPKTGEQNRRSLFDDPFFNRFFGSPMLRDRSQNKVENIGSGVIVTKEGLVVTNHHVIEDASIRIVMRDKRNLMRLVTE